jgi:hypothetical protein
MIDVSGVEGAGPIWRDAMMAAALGRSMSWYARPAGIVETTVCAPTGLLPGAVCQSPVRELFVAGTEPVARESYYLRDSDGRTLINPPVEARAWAREAGLALAADGQVATDRALRVVTPAAGTIYRLAPELSAQRVLFRASASPGIETITFELDGVVIASRPANDPSVLWDLVPGRHTLRVSAPGLATVTSSFEVKR